MQQNNRHNETIVTQYFALQPANYIQNIRPHIDYADVIYDKPGNKN